MAIENFLEPRWTEAMREWIEFYRDWCKAIATAKAEAKSPAVAAIMDAGEVRPTQRWTIAQTDTVGAERAMLLAALRWVNLSTWQLWPSVGHWAAHAGIAARSGRRVLRQLQDKGLVVVVQPSAGGVTASGKGCTTIYELRLPELRANPDTASGLSEDPAIDEPGPSVPKPGPCVPRTRTTRPGNPDVGSANPSIHQPIEPTKEPSKPEVVFESGADGWMDNMSGRTERVKTGAANPRVLLESLGVRVPNLTKLIDADVTVEQIRTEFDSIKRDGGVRNLAAVLVQRLATRLGVHLARRPPTDAKTNGLIGNIENLRRHTPMRPSPQSVAAILGEAARGDAQAHRTHK